MIYTLVAVLNKQIPYGKALNALAHITVGLGHRINGMPNIAVYFANRENVYDFRQHIKSLSETSIITSDFTHTMTEETAVEQLARTAQTPENELEYYVVCALLPTTTFRENISLFDGCQQLVDYENSQEDHEVDILPPQESSAIDETDYKLAMVIGKQKKATLLNPLIHSCLYLGREANFSQLRLLNYRDANGNGHENISFHPFPILTPKNATKHKAMADAIENSKTVGSVVGHTIMTLIEEKQKGKIITVESPVVSVVFGETLAVDGVISRKDTSLFREELEEAELAASAPAAQAQNTSPLVKSMIAGLSLGSSSSSSAAATTVATVDPLG